MTPEEAAEEILGGRAYTTCTRCAGSGWSEKPRRFDITGLRLHCEGCDGSGQWLRGDYVAACHIVGREPPPTPRRQTTLLKPWPRKEYMGVWSEPEERNDTADAMKYALSTRLSNKRL